MTILSRRKLLKSSLATGAAALAAPALGQAAATVRIGTTGLPTTLEPLTAVGLVGAPQVDAIFDTLIRRDFFADGAQGTGTALVPAIAEDWEVSDDNTTLTVRLRDGVKFHDGSEVTAEDVAFSFGEERVFGETALVPRGRSYMPPLERTEVVDERTVRLHAAGPNVAFAKYMASIGGWVVPKARYLDLGPEEFGRAPIGTGPYKFVALEADNQLVLEAHEDYYLGAPSVKSVVFQAIPEPATRVAALISGDIEIATTLSPDDARLLGRFGDIEVIRMVFENCHLLNYNCANGVLQDKRVRQAMNAAIDRQLLSDTLWGGAAVVPNGYQFPSYGEMYDPDRPGFAYDPEKARALLSEAGYQGEPITYWTRGNYYANAIPAMLMIQQMWREVGINLVPDITEIGTRRAPEEIMIRNWSNTFRIPDPLSPLIDSWSATSSPQSTYGWQPEEFNELSDFVRATPDSPERFEAFQKVLDIFEEDAPGTVLYRPLDIYAKAPGIDWHPTSFTRLDLRPYNLARA